MPLKHATEYARYVSINLFGIIKEIEMVGKWNGIRAQPNARGNPTMAVPIVNKRTLGCQL